MEKKSMYKALQKNKVLLLLLDKLNFFVGTNIALPIDLL